MRLGCISLRVPSFWLASRFAAILRRLYNGIGVTVKESSNDQWLVALRGPTRDEALAELRVVLMRGLRAALGGQADRVESSVEDLDRKSTRLNSSHLGISYA